MHQLLQYKYTLIYIIGIVLANIGFVYVPLIPIFNTMFPPMSIFVGLIFVLRDFSQKEIGHKVLFAMVTGAILSYVMANPYVALASFVAFFVSESIDWLVFTVTNKPIHKRILISSFISTPIDSAIFLYMIGSFSFVATFLMFASKMIAAFIIFWYLKNDKK